MGFGSLGTFIFVAIVVVVVVVVVVVSIGHPGRNFKEKIVSLFLLHHVLSGQQVDVHVHEQHDGRRNVEGEEDGVNHVRRDIRGVEALHRNEDSKNV